MSNFDHISGVSQGSVSLLSSAEQKSLKQDVKALVQDSRSLAQEILANGRPSYSSTSSTTVHHHHYSYGGWWCPTPIYQPVYVVGGDRRRRDDDTGMRVLVGVAAAVVGGVAMYTIGRSINDYQHADEEVENAHRFHDRLESCRGRVPEKDNGVVEQASKLAGVKARVHLRAKSSSLFDMISRVVLAVSAALALAGAFAASPWLMVAGTVVGVVVGAAMLFKCGLNTPDRYNIRDALRMQQLARDLEKQLSI